MDKIKLIALLLMVFFVVSCTDSKEVLITYQVSNSISVVNIEYYDNNEILQSTSFLFESNQDFWSLSMPFKEGDIVYLSAIYQDSLSSAKLQIFLDGKLFIEKSSNQDPEQYLILSGTIPYSK